MIDFEEELKKFHPSLEVADSEDTVHSYDVSDMLDLLFNMLNVKTRENEQGGVY
ncbi:MAG: hypothetical protein J6O55_08310 [Lachnospiraceae bacterium]|nr:hypothetical protein [Lachnospiraceae bacterium]